MASSNEGELSLSWVNPSCRIRRVSQKSGCCFARPFPPRRQAQLDTLRNKERLMAEELTELKCRYREDFARLSRQKEEALESQQRLLRVLPLSSPSLRV